MRIGVIYIISLGAVAALGIIGDVILGMTGHDQTGLLKVTAVVVGAMAAVGSGVMKLTERE